jgi:hypothetical protein
MTEADIQCLKDNIDKLVEIRTVDAECLIAKIQIVTDDDEYHVHDVMYEVISSNQIDTYAHLENSGGYLLDFVEIVSVKPIPQPQVVSLTPE